jgi:hypothetical protein
MAAGADRTTTDPRCSAVSRSGSDAVGVRRAPNRGLFWINLVLVFAVVGIVTMPLTWIAYLVLGPLLAARGVERHNASVVAGTHAAITPSY